LAEEVALPLTPPEASALALTTRLQINIANRDLVSPVNI
jgi:hypothetical protein